MFFLGSRTPSLIFHNQRSSPDSSVGHSLLSSMPLMFPSSLLSFVSSHASGVGISFHHSVLCALLSSSITLHIRWCALNSLLAVYLRLFAVPFGISHPIFVFVALVNDLPHLHSRVSVQIPSCLSRSCLSLPVKSQPTVLHWYTVHFSSWSSRFFMVS